MTILTKFFAIKNALTFHPIVLRTCKTAEEFIVCLDSNIHFTKVHQIADKQLPSYPIGKLFNRYENILIEEEGRTMWDLKEASQATSFYSLADKGVITGTFPKMKQTYPETEFFINQKNPDVAHNYEKAIFFYKGASSYDYKNIMGKTKMEGLIKY